MAIRVEVSIHRLPPSQRPVARGLPEILCHGLAEFLFLSITLAKRVGEEARVGLMLGCSFSFLPSIFDDTCGQQARRYWIRTRKELAWKANSFIGLRSRIHLRKFDVWINTVLATRTWRLFSVQPSASSDSQEELQ